MSKYIDEEFLPYLKHFFGKNDEKSEILFKKAVESHKKTNLHHPEAWIDKRGRVHDMPYVYIVEMICDWWSFSIAKGEMTEIIDYYNANKDKLQLSFETRFAVELILEAIEKNYKNYIEIDK